MASGKGGKTRGRTTSANRRGIRRRRNSSNPNSQNYVPF